MHQLIVMEGGAALQSSSWEASSLPITNHHGDDVGSVVELGLRAAAAWTTVAILAVPLAMCVRMLINNLRLVRQIHASGIPEEKNASVLLGHTKAHAAMDYRLCSYIMPMLLGDDAKLTWYHRGGKQITNPLIFLRRFLLSEPQIIVADPRALQSIFVTNAYKFVKPSLGRLLIGNALGHKGLFTIEHDVHRRHRRLLNPVFNMRNLKQLIPDFLSCYDDLHKYLVKAGPETILPFHSVAARATLAVVGRTAMGDDFDAMLGKSPEAEAFEYLTGSIELRLETILRIHMPAWLQWALLPRERRAIKVIDDAVYRIIHRTRLEKSGNALAAVLVQSVEGGQLDEHELKCEISTFIAAGHETSASILASTIFQLALHPHVQERLFDEITTHLRDISDYDVLQKLPILNNVIFETQRLFPVAYFTLREVDQDVDIPTTNFGVVRFPKGAQVIVPIRSIHMMPHIWGDDADKWRPKRWEVLDFPLMQGGSGSPIDETASMTGSVSSLSPNCAGSSGVWERQGSLSRSPSPDRRSPERSPDRGSALSWDYLPFLGGPRGCIGRQFAMMELRIYIAGLVRDFRISTELRPDQVEMRGSITAKPRNAYLRFAPRAGATKSASTSASATTK